MPGRIIGGPIESGKSVTCAAALYAAMCTMPKDRSGKRRSRWLVTRSTYPELRGSTVETFLKWFDPAIYGKFRDSEPYSYQMRFLDVEAEVVFESFLDDRDETIRSLRSKEYSGCWVNECQFTPRRLFFELASRTGRYPRKADMPDGWQNQIFIIGDHNAPFDGDHWILRMRGEVELPLDMPPEERMQYACPSWLKFFQQPPALKEEMGPDGKTVRGYVVNPEAENLKNMGEGVRSTEEMERLARAAREQGAAPPKPHRYIELIGGRSKDELDRDLLCRVVRVKSGAPATPQFRKERHVGSAEMQPVDGVAVVIGADHGLTPAALFAQSINGGWVVFDELVETNKDTNEFAPLVKAKLLTVFPWVGQGSGGYVAWGDPQGDWRGGTSDKRTPFQLYAAHGVTMRSPAAKDRPMARLAATRDVLSKEFNGKPRLLIHPRCKRLIESLDGGAQVRRVKTADGMKLVEEIVKNSASHVFEALGYLLWGGGEVAEMLKPAGAAERPRIQNAMPKKRRLITVGRRMR